MFGSLGSRNYRALGVFFGGVLVFFTFFATGAYIGRWSQSAGERPRTAASEQPRGASESYLVEAAVLDTEDKADQKVQQLRRQYTSARAELSPADRLYHVYIGPYNGLDTANTVADELRQLGLQSVLVKPAQPRPAP